MLAESYLSLQHRYFQARENRCKFMLRKSWLTLLVY
jgi:hypothetical protein